MYLRESYSFEDFVNSHKRLLEAIFLDEGSRSSLLGWGQKSS
jgi:hypothetical protein